MPGSPLVFISHKHSDKTIASAVAKFIQNETTQPIRVFMSSDPQFEGVRFGKGITGEIKKALADADVFLLVYTSADEDWSWCMWEWGVANHPASATTAMVVLQCGSDVPKIDTATRRVNVRKLDEIQAFVKQYFTDTEMFSSLKGQALGAFLTKEAMEDKSTRLFSSLSQLTISVDPAVERSAWPYLQIEVPISVITKINNLSSSLDMPAQIALVRESAKISLADDKALHLFRLIGMEKDAFFSHLANVWVSAYPGAKSLWFEYCCEQIAEAGADKMPGIRTIGIREVGGDAEFVPVVTKVRRASYRGTVRFDLYFLNLPSRSAKAVTSEMLRLDQFYWKPFSEDKLKEMRLLTISEDLKNQAKNRLPLLDEKEVIRYIIHRASIDEFIVANLSNASDLSMADLLNDSNMRSMFERTFAVVSTNATIKEARAKISGAIRDVFVTETGSPQEPVRGWLTNVDLGKDS